MEYFVSTAGSDTNPGSADRPFRSVGRGVDALVAGDVLTIRHGVYVGPVRIAGKHGTADNPIVIRSHPGEHAYLDGTVTAFRGRTNQDWLPASTLHEDAVDDEYVSAATFPDEVVNRGAFLDRNPYTRLVTYSNLKDLRAGNETFDKIVDGDDPRPGPVVVDEAGNSLGYRHPWVYLGPGIYFNAASRRVHVRLSHTHNNVPGIVDYRDETDPRRVPLAIAPRDLTTLRISGSSYLRLEHLTIAHGGDDTIVIERSQQLTLDHVRVRAGTRGVRIGGPAENPTREVAFTHCRFDGGLPTWQFRTDRMSVYHFLDGGNPVPNNLGENTSEALLLGSPNNTAVVIHHCEFLHGHDVLLNGSEVDFHHNLIRDLQGDALALGFDAGTNGPVTVTKIHDNVVTRALVGFGFGSRNQTTRWCIYRNLIDLRERVRGFRPRQAGDTQVWRHGLPHTSDGDTFGPHDLFQNTFLTNDQREQASFLHYRSTTGPHARRSFNNVFVAVNPTSAADRAISFLPSPSFPGPTDGNLYHRIGHSAADPIRYLGYRFQGNDFTGGTFADLRQLRGSPLFAQSRSQYPPGYEANGVLADPSFRRVSRGGQPRDDDDLRLDGASPALGAGVRLPGELGALDPFQPETGNPDIGCYPHGAAPLRVGVDGCRSYPRAPDPPAARPRKLAGGVWRSVFLHEFLDGDPANHRAVPGELTVLPDGLDIDPTPDPAERGFEVEPGRSLSYRFDQRFEDVIGVDLSVDLLFPRPVSGFGFTVARLEGDSVILAVIPPSTVFIHLAGRNLRSEFALPIGSATRLRVRWHTHGQVQFWQDGELRAYEPNFVAGGSLALDSLGLGGNPAAPPPPPTPLPLRYFVRRVYLKLLRSDDARQRIDGHLPLDTTCLPPNACVEEVRRLHEELRSRTRVFMAGTISRLTTPWREGEEPGPFSPESITAHAAAVGAADAFSSFLETRQESTADTVLQRMGEFFDVLAAADPDGFAVLLTELTERAGTLDPVCRNVLEPFHAANAGTLRPLVRLMQATWQRALSARPGVHDA